MRSPIAEGESLCTMFAPMSTTPRPEAKRQLTQEAFASFLFWLSPDQEQAAREYLEIRKKLAKSFVYKGCVHAEDLADRTLDRVALIVHKEPGKYSKPISLCCGVAKRVLLEYRREIVPGALEDDNIPAHPQEDGESTEHEAHCLTRCLDQLSLRDRELITLYHRYEGHQKIETRRQMAEMYGGLNKLRITAFRIRARLFECVRGCVQHSAIT